MTTTLIELNLTQENIRNIFVDSFGNYVAITSQNNIIGNDFRFSIKIDFDFPHIRIIDNENILIIDDNWNIEKNAYVIDYSGNIKLKFYAGIGIEDIKINKKKIIVSYFDEGVFGKVGPNKDGISIFDFNGKQIFGYISHSANNNFVDCYCLSNFGNDKIIFYGYSDFQLREFNLNTNKIAEFQTPTDFLGASSISTSEENIIFHSSYKEKTTFFVWNTKSNELRKIESNEKNLNGTDNGTFFKFSKKSFTLIKPLE